MSNEYDYSGLYNNTSGSGQPNGQNPQPEQSAPAQNPQPQQSSYPNVGSSGANTANTARTDYSSYNSGSTSGQNPQQDHYLCRAARQKAGEQVVGNDLLIQVGGGQHRAKHAALMGSTQS